MELAEYLNLVAFDTVIKTVDLNYHKHTLPKFYSKKLCFL